VGGDGRAADSPAGRVAVVELQTGRNGLRLAMRGIATSERRCGGAVAVKQTCRELSRPRREREASISTFSRTRDVGLGVGARRSRCVDSRAVFWLPRPIGSNQRKGTAGREYKQQGRSPESRADDCSGQLAKVIGRASAWVLSVALL